MSQFYKPNRKIDWNFGGKNYKMSRSRIDLFLQCPRCFYIDNKLGVARPPGFPFNLNSAVDKLLKKEFDMYRAKKEAHPLMKKYGITAVPFIHPDLDKWRENFVGVQYVHPKLNLTISGAVDDVWHNDNGELHIVDYKSTSKDEEVNLDADWQIGYKRQMEIYQWLLRKNGHKVSNTGYFVYCNGNTDKEAFDAKLEFDIKIIPYVGDDSWVEETIIAAHKTLSGETIPKAGDDCDYCRYRDAVKGVVETKEKPAGFSRESVTPKPKSGPQTLW